MNQSLIHVPPPDLPADYRRLVDPDVPLHPGQTKRFVPEPGVGFAFNGLLGAVCAVLGLSILVTTLTTWLGHTAAVQGDKGALAVGPLLALFCLLLAAYFSFRTMTGLGDRRALREGRYRRGLFVLDEGLLFFDKQGATWVPRERLVDVTIQRRGAMPGSHRAAVIFEGEGGKAYEYPLPGNEDLFKALQSWRVTGNFDFQKSPGY